MSDMRKLGKLPPKFSKKTLKMSDYLPNDAPHPPPVKAYWEYKVKNWPMFANDRIGDCVFAAAGHMEENWSAHTGPQVEITDDQIIKAYSEVTGYVPGDANTDNGAAITDFLEWWHTTGLAGKKIDGWASINPQKLENVKKGIFLFGGIDIGVNLPQSAMDQTDRGEPWDVEDNDGGILGGHCVPVLGYGREGCTCITWGQLQQMSWDWFKEYCDEAYAIVSLSWIDKSGVTPSHLDIATLRLDLAALKS